MEKLNGRVIGANRIMNNIRTYESYKGFDIFYYKYNSYQGPYIIRTEIYDSDGVLVVKYKNSSKGEAQKKARRWINSILNNIEIYKKYR